MFENYTFEITPTSPRDQWVNSRISAVLCQAIYISSFSKVFFYLVVALNYQTPDDHMMIYKGRFRDNGGCGYILKPAFLRNRKLWEIILLWLFMTEC